MPAPSPKVAKQIVEEKSIVQKSEVLNEKEKKQRKAETLLKEAKRRTEAKFDARNEARKAKLRHKELERAEIGSDAFASYKEHVAELQAKAQE